MHEPIRLHDDGHAAGVAAGQSPKARSAVKGTHPVLGVFARGRPFLVFLAFWTPEVPLLNETLWGSKVKKVMKIAVKKVTGGASSCAGPLAPKKKAGVEQEGVGRIFIASAPTGPPGALANNNALQCSRPGAPLFTPRHLFRPGSATCCLGAL
jgi:hypothetical protein